MDRFVKTEVITPNRRWWNLGWVELWSYRDLILLFVKRDFVTQYKQTILGPLWYVIQPILTALMFLLVFGRLASIPTNGVDPFLFYYTGLTIWGYFSDCLMKTSNTFNSNAHLFGKVYFPRLAVPVSIVLSGFIRFFINILVLLVCMACFHYSGQQLLQINSTLLFFPIYVLILALLGLGFGILFSALTTKYRDLSFLLGFGIQLAMYATPIIYPLSFTQGTIHKLVSYNPLAPILENIRFSLFNCGAFNGMGILYSFAFSCFVLCFGLIAFNRVEKTFMDTV